VVGAEALDLLGLDGPDDEVAAALLVVLQQPGQVEAIVDDR
jgi:hypothetical protein